MAARRFSLHATTSTINSIDLHIKCNLDKAIDARIKLVDMYKQKLKYAHTRRSYGELECRTDTLCDKVVRFLDGQGSCGGRVTSYGGRMTSCGGAMTSCGGRMTREDVYRQYVRDLNEQIDKLLALLIRNEHKIRTLDQLCGGKSSQPPKEESIASEPEAVASKASMSIASVSPAPDFFETEQQHSDTISEDPSDEETSSASQVWNNDAGRQLVQFRKSTLANQRELEGQSPDEETTTETSSGSEVWNNDAGRQLAEFRKSIVANRREGKSPPRRKSTFISDNDTSSSSLFSTSETSRSRKSSNEAGRKLSVNRKSSLENEKQEQSPLRSSQSSFQSDISSSSDRTHGQRYKRVWNSMAAKELLKIHNEKVGSHPASSTVSTLSPRPTQA